MNKFQAAKVTGRISEKTWVGVENFFCPPRIHTQQAVFDEIGCVIVVTSPDQFVNLGAFGKQVLQQLRLLAGQGLVASTLSLESVRDKLIANLDQVHLELLLVGRCSHQIFLVFGGGGSAGLFRQGVLGLIADASSGSASVSGELQTGDILILGTTEFFQKVNSLHLKQVLNQFVPLSSQDQSLAPASPVDLEVNHIAEELALITQRLVTDSGVGALILGYAPAPPPDTWSASATPSSPRSLLKRFITRLIHPSPIKIKVRGDISLEEKRHRRIGILIFTLLVIILSISVTLGWRKRVNQQQQQQVTAITTPAQQLIDQAQIEQGVNRLRARALLLQAISQLETGVAQFKAGSTNQQQVTSLLQQAQSDYQQVSGLQQVIPTVFLDLSLVKDNLVAEKLAVSGDQLLVADPITSTVVLVDSANKKASVIAGGSELSGLKLLAATDPTGFALADAGVVSFSLSTSQSKVAVETDPEWQSPVSLGAFGSAVYILDSGVGEIWKYTINSAGAVRKRWLAPGVNPDFANVVDLTIDGDIWVLDQNGTVRQYSQGASTGFAIADWGDQIGEARAIATDDTYVYVLDRSQKRVVAFDKQGNYQKQYQSDQLATASDMVVAAGKILFLSSGVLYQISI